MVFYRCTCPASSFGPFQTSLRRWSFVPVRSFRPLEYGIWYQRKQNQNLPCSWQRPTYIERTALWLHFVGICFGPVWRRRRNINTYMIYVYYIYRDVLLRKENGCKEQRNGVRVLVESLQERKEKRASPQSDQQLFLEWMRIERARTRENKNVYTETSARTIVQFDSYGFGLFQTPSPWVWAPNEVN